MDVDSINFDFISHFKKLLAHHRVVLAKTISIKEMRVDK